MIDKTHLLKLYYPIPEIKMKKTKYPKAIVIVIFLFIFSVSIFAQADITRTTTAVVYPLDTTVQLQFRGTTRFPRMKGEAKIKRTSKNGTEIDLTVSKMPRPFELGAGYATYVLWAISPEGQVDNLGEIKRRGFFEFDSKMSVTTPLQTFALIVTAEPHFLVRRPSRAIMLENLNPVGQSGQTIATTKAAQYFGNSSDYFSDARTPEIAETDYSKTPSTILQAKQAVALARFAGAQRDANNELQEAETLLMSAENAWKAGRAEADVDVTARQAVGAAVRAENMAVARKESREKRNEKMQQDAELQKSEDKYLDALQQIENLKFELARETRNRELTERDASNYSEQIKQLRDENIRLRTELDKYRKEASEAKFTLAKIEGEKEAIEKQREQEQKVARLQASMPALMQSLKTYGAVKQTERGIVLTLPENVWTGIRATSLSAANEAKISNLANIVANSPDYKIVIESHTDSQGTPGELMTLTEERAKIISEKFAGLGVTGDRLEAKGMGASLPISPNTTNLNRAKNRRIDVILVPNIN